MFGTVLRRVKRHSGVILENLSEKQRIDVLLEEYRVLYALLAFRLDAMERRLPFAGALLAVLLGGTTAMPETTNLVFLIGLPAAFALLLGAMVAHSRAKEDHVRRIDEIERLVNQLAGEELLVFQSRHPNKRLAVAGRSGQAVLRAVLATNSAMIATTGFFAARCSLLNQAWLDAFHAYAALCVLYMFVAVARLSRYRYSRPPLEAPLLFEARSRTSPDV